MKRSLFPNIERISGHSFIPELLPADSVVFDLGANCGNFSRTLSERFGWHCFAVEPNKAVWKTIETTPSLRTLNCAINSRNGPVEFAIHSNSESSSIRAVAAAEACEKVVVEGITYEALIDRCGVDRVDLLKMDVEGAEGPVLESMNDAELRGIRQIAIEFHELSGLTELSEMRRAIERLRGLGFLVLKMSVRHYADVLFVNRRLCGLNALRAIGLSTISRSVSLANRYIQSVKRTA